MTSPANPKDLPIKGIPGKLYKLYIGEYIHRTMDPSDGYGIEWLSAGTPFMLLDSAVRFPRDREEVAIYLEIVTCEPEPHHGFLHIRSFNWNNGLILQPWPDVCELKQLNKRPRTYEFRKRSGRGLKPHGHTSSIPFDWKP